jgi:ATP-dependent Clp protease ATP-binding subunit ClpA
VPPRWSGDNRGGGIQLSERGSDAGESGSSASPSGRTICRLAFQAADAADPEAALETLTRLRAEVDEFERQQVARALTAGRSFGSIARALGISRQAVHYRFSGLSPKKRLTRSLLPSPEVRLVFEYAGAEAQALGATLLNPAHVLLGLLRNGDSRAAGALVAAGVTLEDARGAARAQENGSGRRRAIDAVDVRAMLGQSVRCAKSRDAERIEAEHVLRAALADGASEGPRLLEQLGIPPASVLAALDEAPADVEG